MKILAIADEESQYLWDYFKPEKLQDIDLILSCGDLKAQYLTFLATFTHAPILYVHGNHDERYLREPPESCICIEDMVYTWQGVRILGLGGSMRYRPGAFQYTDKQMEQRVKKLRRRLQRTGGFDILLTHAPARGVNDASDTAHRGFEAFNGLMDAYSPDLFVHGHVHMNYGHQFPRESQYGDTRVINAYERYVFEYVPPQSPPCEPAGLRGFFARAKNKK